jgi:hypothetical protein
LSLNQSNLNQEENVSLKFRSPSRPLIELEKPVTDLGSGFFLITLTADESNELIDDTYSYRIEQNSTTLKLGFVRVVSEEISNFTFDYLLDFLMA